LILNTFNNWLKKYKDNTLTVDLRKNNHAKIKITEHFKKKVRDIISENGLHTITFIRNKLKHNFNYSISTYYRTIHDLNFSYKKVHHFTMPPKYNSEIVLKKIKEKQNELCSIGINNIVAIDEVPFYQEMHPLYGWSPKGEKLKVRRHAMRSKHYSVLCAMSADGNYQYKIVESGNEVSFKKFLVYSVMRKFKDKTHFLMDNARIHHCKKTVEYIKKKGKMPIYTVPYTPELNPIEPSFSVIKNKVRHLQPNTEEQLKSAIEIAVPLMTPEKCWNMFRNSFGLTDYKIKR